MTALRSAVMLAVMVLGACSAEGGARENLSTGLSGYVVRGPIQPVCLAGEPCDDAPFSATFTAYRGGRLVLQFRSDSLGAFTVGLAPGLYRVVPAPDAPLLAPETQGKDVEVGQDGLTIVRLAFDTGIR